MARRKARAKDAAAADPPTRRYRVTNLQASGDPEFEVPADATQDEIAAAAADVVAEYLSYGWEVTDDE